MKIKNIDIYLEAAAEIMNVSIIDIVKERNDKKMKYILVFALEFGFLKEEVLQKFGKYRAYFTMIKKKYPDLRNDIEYKNISSQIEKVYLQKISKLPTKSILENKNNTIVNDLRDKLLFFIEQNKRLKNEIIMIKRQYKSERQISQKKSDILFNEIKKMIIDYNIIDDSRFNAKITIDYITKKIFHDVPDLSFEKRQYFEQKKKKS